MTVPSSSPPARRRTASLSKTALVFVLALTFLMGATAILIGYHVFSEAMEDQYLDKAYSLARTAASIVDSDPLVRYSLIVRQIYESLTPEQLTDQNHAYLEQFESLTEQADWQAMRADLQAFSKENDLMEAIIFLADHHTHTAITVVDSGTTKNYCPPGTLERITNQLELAEDGKAILSDYEEFGLVSSAIVPLRHKSKGLPIYLAVDISVNEITAQKNRFLINFGAALILAMVIHGLLASWFVRRRVVTPINHLAKAASGYSQDQALANGQHGASFNHFANLNIHTGDEMERLGTVMADMEAKIADYIDRITRVTAEKQRIDTELSIAAQIQSYSLPQTFPAYPDRYEFDLYASMDPAKQVGGDFYDFFLVDDDHLCVVIADVSDKGMPAALYMMFAKGMIKAEALWRGSPKVALEAVNRLICDQKTSGMFVTVWIGLLEISSGALTCVNAGHENPIIRRRDGAFREFRDKHGLMVGAIAQAKYTEYTLILEPGDTLFVYTDGVPEAKNPSGEMYGTQRLEAALNRMGPQSPEALLHGVRADLDAFVDGTVQFDDITMLSLRYNGADGTREEAAT